MKIEKFDGTQERQIVTAMIVDPDVLAAVSARYESGMLPSRWAAIVAGWCVDYHRKYRKAPGKDVEGLFRQWVADKSPDPDTAKAVERFLAGLSGDYVRLKKKLNPQFVIDTAARFFRRARAEQVADEIKAKVAAGDVEAAEKLYADYRPADIAAAHGISVLKDLNPLKAAFRAKREPLVTFPGALGTFFGDVLGRGNFVCLMGPVKTGKSFWLLELAWTAVEQGRQTALFQIGDMTQNQMYMRLASRIAGVPTKARSDGQPVRYPTRFVSGEPPEFEDREFGELLTLKQARRAFRKAAGEYGDDLLRMAVYPNSTITAAGLEGVIDGWGRLDGWVPDVVVIDYLDLIAPPKGYNESRDQINATWKHLRAMNQKLNCLLVGATQVKATGFTAETLDKEHFSEDNRKLAHVDGMVGLNQTREEKDSQVMRLNWVVRREADFSAEHFCHVVGCLDVARPVVLSSF